MLLKLAVNSPKDNAVEDTPQTRQHVIYELGRVDGTAGGRGAATVSVCRSSAQPTVMAAWIKTQTVRYQLTEWWKKRQC